MLGVARPKLQGNGEIGCRRFGRATEETARTLPDSYPLGAHSGTAGLLYGSCACGEVAVMK